MSNFSDLGRILFSYGKLKRCKSRGWRLSENAHLPCNRLTALTMEKGSFYYGLEAFI